MKGMVEVNIVGEHGVENSKGLSDLGKDGQIEDLELYRKIKMIPPPPNCK